MQARDDTRVDRGLIKRFAGRYRRFLLIVVVASIVVNLLVFAGSAYMLLVYDSVLPSRSEPTLFGLIAMLVLLHLMQGALELNRSEALLSVANGIWPCKRLNWHSKAGWSKSGRGYGPRPKSSTGAGLAAGAQ